MGSASCKTQKSSELNQKKDDSKKITIGVFGLNNAGKTSAVKAIEGVPTEDAAPTISSETTKVPYPTTGKGDSKSQERITIIDLSGAKRFRQRSWPEYYKKIHGLIYVIDASEKKSMTENKNTLEELLENDDLKDKPILIFANKQDQRGAIDKETQIKDKLQIEELRRKHKIEFCTAIPRDHNKVDDSIRKGFSWLIRTIESDYTKLNSRVINETNSRAPKPTERKSQMNNRRKNEYSDESDKDDGVVYTHARTGSPPLNKKTTDYRGTITSTKLPNLDLSKTKKKPSGNETYSESDHEDHNTLSRSRSNINQRDQSFNLPSLTSTGGLNTKKKGIGVTGTNSDLLTKKSNDSELKSFRSTYEPFNEEPPWSSVTKKPIKYDDLTSRSYNKPSVTNDLNKRIMSPLVRDTKPFNSSIIQKRENASDDDEYGFNQKQKAKPTIPLINKPSSTFNKPSSTFNKPLSTIYGDDDDDDLKGSNINRRLNVTAPITPKKPYKNDDDDDDDDYLKKNTSKTTKGFGSDDENKKQNNITKPYQRPIERFNPMNDYRGTTSKPPPSPLINDYRGTTSKPPPSPSIKISSSKFDDDDRPSSLSSKPVDRFKSNKDDYLSTYSKPTTSSKFRDDDDDRPVSISKINTQSKYSDDDYPSSLSKLSTRPKYGDDNRPLSPIRLNTRSKQGDYNLPLSTSKPSVSSKYDDDDDLPSVSKPVTRFNYTSGDRPGSAVKSTSRSRRSDDDDDDYGSKSKPSSKSKYEDDDDYGSKSKPSSKSKYDDDDDYGSKSKPSSKSKYNDDDDDYGSKSKPSSKSKYDDDDDYGSKSKPSSKSKYDDDDDYGSKSKPSSKSKYDDDDDYGSKSKPSSKSKYDDDDDYGSKSKPTSKSKYEDDDDDYPSSKPTTRSSFKDNIRSSSPAKSTSRSKYEDDDDYPPTSSKTTTRSSYKDNDRSSSPAKKSTRWNDDDDDDDRSSSGVKPSSRSKFEDDDDLPSYKKTNYSSRDNDYSGTGGGTRSRYGKDDF